MHESRPVFLGDTENSLSWPVSHPLRPISHSIDTHRLLNHLKQERKNGGEKLLKINALAMWLASVKGFFLNKRLTWRIDLIISPSSSNSHFSTWPLAFAVETFSVKGTTSPSLLFMCVISRSSVNTRLAIPSKHFFK